MSELPNPLVPPFPPANLKAGWKAIQSGKAAKTRTPRETEYFAAIEIFYTDYDKVDHTTRAKRCERAMQRLHEHYPEDAEAAIFYALALNGAVDFDDKNYTKQLKAAAILNEEAKKRPNHPGIAHYLIHSYDFAPLAAMCVSTAKSAVQAHPPIYGLEEIGFMPRGAAGNHSSGIPARRRPTIVVRSRSAQYSGLPQVI
jgi:hypothetical protein